MRGVNWCLNRSLVITATAVGLVMTIVAPLHAETVTIAVDRDNTIVQDSDELSNGQGLYFFAGRTGQIEDGIRRALLHFPVEDVLPAGSEILAVTVTLNVSRTRNGNAPVSFHRLLSDWGEGASMSVEGTGGGSGNGRGAFAEPGDATWEHTFFDDQFWDRSGGDFESNVSTELTLTDEDIYTWPTTTALVADVQGWVDFPDTNFGWILRGDEENSPSTFRFDSAQNLESPQTPIVTITFQPPGDPVACCTSAAVCEELNSRVCEVTRSGFLLANESCEDIESCCIEDVGCDDQNDCTTDLCVDGVCNHENIDGICDDGDECSTGDICANGQCVGSRENECCRDEDCDDGDPCTTDACQDGACEVNAHEGTCDDQDPCTENDQCIAGVCQGTPVADCCVSAQECDDEDPCTLDACVSNACMSSLLDDAPCDDERSCTENDTCLQGLCEGTMIQGCCDTDIDCDDQDECTSDLCENSTCSNLLIDECGNNNAAPCGAMGSLPLILLSMMGLFLSSLRTGRRQGGPRS
ncbi:MAG: DNRLRE domain-containing protein [Phycisphaerae bacterium]